MIFSYHDFFQQDHIDNKKMPDSDNQRRFIIETTNVRGVITHLNASWRAMIQGRDYPDAVSHLLGQTAVAASLLSSTLKFEGSLSIQIQDGQPLTLLVIQIDSDQHLRGMAKWSGDITSDDLNKLCDGAKLSIHVEQTNGQRYQSIVELNHNSLAEALEAYFKQSEQLPTRLWIATDNDTAAGLLLQTLPTESSDEELDADAWNRATMLADTVTNEELLTLPAEQLLHRLYHEEDLRLFSPNPIAFRCSCSRDRIATTLRSMGKTELESIIEEQGQISINCNFCQQSYAFDPIDFEQLFVDGTSPNLPPRRH